MVTNLSLIKLQDKHKKLLLKKNVDGSDYVALIKAQ